jgi:uncharacterized membrane protein
MKTQHASALALSMGAVAGLRPMTALAVVAWSAKRRWIDLGISPLANLISARAPRRITELAISELIADKMPFTPSRLNTGPLASRIALGAICGAAVCGAVRRAAAKGALLGGLAAIAGTLGGHYVRRSLRRRMPDFAAGLLEDGLAVGGSALIVALTANAK